MKLAKHDLGGKLNDGENDGGKNKRRGISEKELEEYTEKKGIWTIQGWKW